MAKRIKLTKSAITKLEPQSTDVIYWDDDLSGFGIKVTPRGRKVFLVMYRPKGHHGAARKYTLGTFGEWSVQAARQKAQEVLTAGNQGRDIGAEEKAEAHRRSQDRISDLVEAFLDKHASKNRTGDQTRRIFAKDVLPVIGRRSVHDIKKSDVIGIIDGIASRGAPIMANRTLAAVRKFFNWCVSRDVIERSPAESAERAEKERSRDRVLSEPEIRAILTAARTLGYPFGPFIELLFLTAQRREEVAGMKWSELDLDTALWAIPAERAKNNRAHDVHLCVPAVTLLRSIPKVALPDSTPSPYLFTTTGRTSVSGFSKAKKQIDDMSGVTEWRLHDIRRTVATEMANLQVAIHVTEAILNHKSGTISGITAVYQRAQFLEERRDAMERWCKRLNDIINTNDV